RVEDEWDIERVVSPQLSIEHRGLPVERIEPDRCGRLRRLALCQYPGADAEVRISKRGDKPLRGIRVRIEFPVNIDDAVGRVASHLRDACPHAFFRERALPNLLFGR